MKKSNWVGFIIIYIVAFSIILWYGLAHLPVNDTVEEYLVYLSNIKQGWMARPDLVNSSLVTTYLPALIYNLTHLNPLFIFRLIPALFYSLMPAFAYLIARRYLSIKYSIIAVFVILLSSYFIYFPDMGRVGVAMGFMAGMVWALLEKKLVWAILFAILIVFSHYGESFISIALVGLACLVYLVWEHRIVRNYAVVLVVLIVFTGVWYFGIAKYAGNTAISVLSQQQTVGESTIYSIYQLSKDDLAITPISTTKLKPSTIISSNDTLPSLINIKSRETAIQDALFMQQLSAPQKIEVIANWLMVIMVSLGLFLITRSRDIDRDFKIMACSFYGLILFTIALPWLSIGYTAMRVYYNSTILLAVGFPMAVKKISFKIPMVVGSFLILALYALSTSGIIYEFFGLHKYMTVAIGLVK